MFRRIEYQVQELGVCVCGRAGCFEGSNTKSEARCVCVWESWVFRRIEHQVQELGLCVGELGVLKDRTPSPKLGVCVWESWVFRRIEHQVQELGVCVCGRAGCFEGSNTKSEARCVCVGELGV